MRLKMMGTDSMQFIKKFCNQNIFEREERIQKIKYIIKKRFLSRILLFKPTKCIELADRRIRVQVKQSEGKSLYALPTLCEALGIQILSQDENKIKLKQNENSVEYVIGEQLAANESGYFKLDAATIKCWHTVYVPLESIAYMFGYTMKEEKRIALTKVQPLSQPEADETSYSFMEDRTYIEEMIKLVDPNYYCSALGLTIKELIEFLEPEEWKNLEIYLAELKEYLASDFAACKWYAEVLTTKEGRATYKIIHEFLEQIEMILSAISSEDHSDIEEKIKVLSKMNDEIEQKKKELYDAAYKAASLMMIIN